VRWDSTEGGRVLTYKSGERAGLIVVILWPMKRKLIFKVGKGRMLGFSYFLGWSNALRRLMRKCTPNVYAGAFQLGGFFESH